MDRKTSIITTAELAVLAGVTPRAISYAVEQGDLPSPMLVGRATVWRRDQLAELLDALARRAKRKHNRKVCAA